MKLLTLNTHSIIESDYENKLKIFTDTIALIRPDVIALQEVNQSADATGKIDIDGYIRPIGNICIKSDNHIARVNNALRTKGISYNWSWLPIKNGFDKFDEGIGILSLSPILETKAILLSKTDDYYNWRKRMALGVKTADNVWYYSVHFGWWDDVIEPFERQWNTFKNSINTDDEIWVMGDFNSVPDSSAYKEIINDNWFDTYELAEEKDNGTTVMGEISGWQNDESAKRIDYIFTNKRHRIKLSNIIFNGTNKETVSDHFGVIVEV